MSRKNLRISSVLFIVFFSAGRLYAAECGPGGSSKSREIQNLTRQISALHGLMNKHRCTGSHDGLFSACRDISKRLAGAERSLAAKGSAGCSTRAVSVPQRKTAQPAGEQRRQPSSKRLETMCVRLSDGYYFPSPNSGYGSARDEPLIAAQCQFICNTAGMDVFQVTSGIGTTDEMMSLKAGIKYSDLPNAGAYRIAASTKRCDMARYYRRARDIIRNAASHAGNGARKGEAANVMTAETQIDPVTVGATRNDVLANDRRHMLPQMLETMARPRKVRIIVPGFLPAEDTVIQLVE